MTKKLRELQAVTAFICGPNAMVGCLCNCPDECGHVWDGCWHEEKDESGNVVMQSKTCSRCGMLKFDHDILVLP